MTVYSVYMNEYSGESAIEVFTTEKAALDYIAKDVTDVLELLKESGHNVKTIENDAICHAFVSTDCDIWYQWDVYVSELHN